MNTGILNERKIINVLKFKKLSELPPFWKEEMLKIFNKEDENLLLVCRTIGKNNKTDFQIQYGKQKVNISVKSGSYVSVHCENIKYFIPFLRSLSVSEQTINFLIFYHFGKLKNGDVLNLNEIKTKYADNIKKANLELNSDKVLRAVIYHSVFKGRFNNRVEVDYLYYGNEKYGFFVDKKTLFEYLLVNKNMHLNCLHFSAFIYQPARRYECEKQVYLNLKWPTIFSDIMKIKDKE